MELQSIRTARGEKGEPQPLAGALILSVGTRKSRDMCACVWGGGGAAEGLLLRPPTKAIRHPKKRLGNSDPARVSLLQLPTPGHVPAPLTLLVVVVFQWQSPRAGVRRSALAEWERGREIGVGLGRGGEEEDILRAPINAPISNHSAGGGKKE